MFLEHLPFPRGTTFFTGGTVNTTDADATNLEGAECMDDDIDYSATTPGSKPKRSAHKVRLRIVRNKSGIALLPMRIARFKATAGNGMGQIDGYTTTTAARGAGVIDEWLPTAGCADNDLCYLVVEGPTKVKMPLSNLSADVAVGDALVAITAATSQATTAGRIAAQDLTGATALLANQVQHLLGRAMTTKLTNDTDANILIYVGKM